MPTSTSLSTTGSHRLVTGLTYAMFFMFAMTTDAVGEIIKLAKVEMGLTNIQASAFHWATMVAVAASGIFLGFLADRIGRKQAIILGLGIYGVASALFFVGETFEVYLTLLFVSGMAIGIFKTAALALIGDITTSTSEHTRRMNAVEGFFGVGAIAGPMLVVFLGKQGVSWTWLYLLAAALCLLMIIAALLTRYPETKNTMEEPVNMKRTFALLKNPHAMGFSFAIAMYVASEVAIFVWLPSFLDGYTGSELAMTIAAYAVMIFFVFRALGRFLGVWILHRFSWTSVMVTFSAIIFGCFVASAVFGQTAAVFLLPASGLFMSMIYPTLNSKGISCFPKAEHGAVAGLILFFTAFAAAVGPLLMALVADLLGGGDMTTGFYLATGFAGLLFLAMLFNYIKDPSATALQHADVSEYEGQNEFI